MSVIYQDKTDDLRDFAEKLRAEQAEAAKKIISDNLSKAAQTLVHSMTDSDSDANEIALKKLQKDSAVQLLKFCGFSETTKNEHSGQVKFEPVQFLHNDSKPAENADENDL